MNEETKNAPVMDEKSKKIVLELDDRSIEIMKKLHKIHRVSVVNFAIRLLENTDYYKVLIGEEIEIKSEISDNIAGNSDENTKSENSNTSKEPQKEIHSEPAVEDDFIDMTDF